MKLCNKDFITKEDLFMINAALAPPLTYRKFISLPDERLFLATRTHWFTLIPPTAAIAFISIFLLSAIFMFFLSGWYDIKFLAVGSLGVATVTFAVIATILVKWYYHLYIITTHKILEVRYLPPFYHSVNDVLLDQVRCTEIDVKTSGILNELLNIGNITLTFDRPTHQEEFVLADISNPDAIGMHLGDMLDAMKRNASSQVWYRTHDNKRPFRFTDDIYPKPISEVSQYGI